MKRRFRFNGADFFESTEDLGNPARGWYQIYSFRAEEEPDLENLKWCLKKEEPCALLLIDIGAYRDRDLDGKALTHIRQYLAFFDQNKKDIIFRAAYDTQGRGAEHEPSLLSRVSAHIRQLGPVLREFDRRIILFEGMLVGNWGEMHGSRFVTPKNMAELNEVLAQSIPGVTRAVRRPVQWRMLHRLPPGPGTGVGLYNDAIFGSETDLGTFAPADSRETDWEKPWAARRELDFEEELSAFVPQCGEAVRGETYQSCTLAATVSRLRKMGMSCLNGVYDENILRVWRGWTWTGADVWRGMNGYDYIGRHLGYRFRVKSAGAKLGGGVCQLSVTVENTGFSGFYQQAQALLILTQEDGRETEFLTDWDLREWKSGQSVTCKWTVPCQAGKLWLAARRTWDGETIRFANGGTDRGRVLIGEVKA